MSGNENPTPCDNATAGSQSKLSGRVNCELAPLPQAAGSAARPGRIGESQEGRHARGAVDFATINRAALAAFPAVLARILPKGKRFGAEIVALNPRRGDRNLGSFKINRYNGRWADFATGDKGGDPISLVAYLADVSQCEAARLLAQMLGVESGGRCGG